MKAAHPERDEQDELDVPPAVACTRCGRNDCTGCGSGVEVAPSDPASLPWEARTTRNLGTLWKTAEKTALEPELVFGGLLRGRLLAALAFGLASEGLALLSLGVAGAGLFALIWPLQLLELSRSGAFWILSALGWCTATIGMLAVHGFWGLCIELGAAWGGTAADHQRGFRFSMYSTGWDLLTSPAGVVLGVCFRGVRHSLEPTIRAARIPRRALDAYFDGCRHFDAAARKKASLLTVLGFSSVFLLALLALVLGFVLWIQSALR